MFRIIMVVALLCSMLFCQENDGLASETKNGCARLEGGVYSNPENKPDASCTGGPPLEGSVEIVNRRFIVDVDMGAVAGLANFGDENGWPDSHIFRLENGKLLYIHTLTVCPNGCELPSSQE